LIFYKTSFNTEEFFLLTDKGSVIYANAKDNSVLDSPEFKNLTDFALEGKSAVAGFIDSKSLNAPVLYVAQSVRGENNNGVAVFGKIFDSEQILSMFPYSQGETKGVLLFSGDGKVISSNQDVQMFNNLLQPDINKQVIKNIQKEGEYIKIFNQPEFKGIIKISSVAFNTRMVRPFGFYIEAGDLMRLENNFIYYSIIALVMVIFLIGGSIIITRNKIIGPVVNIEKGFEKLINNDYFYSIVPAGLLEIREIGKGYNMAVKKIKENFKELDEKNKILEAKEREIKKTLENSERANRLMVGRELRMRELKLEIIALKGKLNNKDGKKYE